MANEIRITGGKQCSGSIQISGAKNAVLPLMAACLLTDKKVTLENVPQIEDVNVMKRQLESYNVTVRRNGSTMVLQAKTISSSPTSDVGKGARAPFLVLGAILGRNKEAKVYYPGGCQLGGSRPVGYHIDALKQMGARKSSESTSDYIVMKARQGLRGENVEFEGVSVGATQNILMAACLADGETTIKNAAVEPEVIDLVNMLKEMGMDEDIEVDEGSNTIVIEGRGGNLLGGCTHTVIPDRIEAGTWAIAAAMTGGSLTLLMNPTIGRTIMIPIVEKLKEAGIHVTWQRSGLLVKQLGQAIRPVSIKTGPYPSFPTDLLPQWVTFMTQADGTSVIEEKIFPDRFKHVPHLQNMGAEITRRTDTKYTVHGNAKLTRAHVTATDLRAGAALILAALVAQGTTVIKEIHYVRRGYESIEVKLKRWDKEPSRTPRQGSYGGTRQLRPRR